MDEQELVSRNIEAASRFRSDRPEIERTLAFSVRNAGRRVAGERDGEVVTRADALAERLRTHGGVPAVEAVAGIVIILLETAEAAALAAHSPGVPIIGTPDGEAGFAIFQRGGAVPRLVRGEMADFAPLPGAVVGDGRQYTTWPAAADLAAADAVGAIPEISGEIAAWLADASAELRPVRPLAAIAAAPAPAGRCGSCRHHAAGRCRAAGPERRVGEDGTTDRAAFPAMPPAARCARWAGGQHSGATCSDCAFFVPAPWGLGRCEAFPTAPVDRFGRQTGNVAEYLKISADEPACYAFVSIIREAAE